MFNVKKKVLWFLFLVFIFKLHLSRDKRLFCMVEMIFGVELVEMPLQKACVCEAKVSNTQLITESQSQAEEVNLMVV